MKRQPAYPVYLALEMIVSFLFAMIFTVSSLYQVTIVGLSPLQLVLVGTTLELTVFLLEVPTGVVADVYSRRLSIIIGYVIMGAGFVVEGSFPIFGMILFAQALWGLGYTFTSGATQAWITDEIGEQAAGLAFLRAAQVGQISALLGIGAGMLLGSLRLSLTIQLGGLSLLFVAVLLFLFMPEHGFKPIPRQERNSWQSMTHTFKTGLSVVRQRPALITILAVGLFYGLYSEGFDRLWTKHILEGVGLPVIGNLQPVAWFGIMRAGGLLLSIGFSELARRKVRTDHYPSLARSLLWITALIIAGLLVFAQTDSFLLALLAYWAIYVARNLVDPLYTAWVNQRLDSSVRATVLSMSSQVDALGQIAGGPGVGWIGNVFSVQTAITVSGLLLTPVLALYARFLSGDQPGLKTVTVSTDSPGE